MFSKFEVGNSFFFSLLLFVVIVVTTSAAVVIADDGSGGGGEVSSSHIQNLLFMFMLITKLQVEQHLIFSLSFSFYKAIYLKCSCCSSSFCCCCC